MIPRDETPRLRILHLEDDETDHHYVRELLENEGMRCEFRLVKSRQEYEAALKESRYDLIISDYTVPSFDGMHALEIKRRACPETPFIFFSGTIGEEIAVESLRNGAVDYVLKQRPGRLAQAVRRVLHESAEREQLQRVERALKTSEERYRIVTRASNDIIWEWDIAGNSIWFNDSFRKVFGRDAAQLESRWEGWLGMIHPEDQPRVTSGLAAVLAQGGTAWWSEHRMRRADGTYGHIFDRASVVYDNEGKPSRVVGVAIDVTERRQAEEKIREQAALLDQASDAIILCDLEARIMFWSKGAERLYGWTAAEAVGKGMVNLLLNGKAPAEMQEAIEQLEERGEWTGQLQEFAKDSRRVSVQSRVTVIRGADGKPKSVLIINSDITERKHLEEQLLRAQRLESLGVLVSGIAHDLNNALSPILMGVGILRSELRSKESEPIFSMVEASARRGADMVKQILTFARGGDTLKSLVPMDQLTKEMGKITSDVFPKNIKARVNVARDSWPVSGIPTQLHQVLMNLCVNARDAMPNGGTLTLSTLNVRLDSGEAAKYPDAKPGQYLCISVADTGTGMVPEQLGRIFEPFFTTKAPGKGTGLGLSTSRNIIRSHGGFMTVSTKLGEGSEFRCYLPAAPVRQTLEAPRDAVSLPVGSGQCILVVDDEELVLAITRATLENYGYAVLTAANGPEAVARLTDNSAEVELVITDMSMPFMDGWTTIQALRKIRPDLPVIMASGLDDDRKTDTQRRIRDAVFIQKPFTPENLLTTVHNVLAKRKPTEHTPKHERANTVR
jgi:PAS domain S-box-containing protein